jgi:hypothetical protein
LFGDKRISNPQTVLHLTPEFTPIQIILGSIEKKEIQEDKSMESASERK